VSLRTCSLAASRRLVALSLQKLSMQQLLAEQRRFDSKNPHLVHQITILEESLRIERERKERAVAEVDGLKEQLDKVSRDMVHSMHSKHAKVSPLLATITLTHSLTR
jgi:hypothetical protein